MAAWREVDLRPDALAASVRSHTPPVRQAFHDPQTAASHDVATSAADHHRGGAIVAVAHLDPKCPVADRGLEHDRLRRVHHRIGDELRHDQQSTLLGLTIHAEPVEERADTLPRLTGGCPTLRERYFDVFVRRDDEPPRQYATHSTDPEFRRADSGTARRPVSDRTEKGGLPAP